MVRVKIGAVGVDSGQLLLADPCYLRHWVADDPVSSPDYPHGFRPTGLFGYSQACAVTCSEHQAGDVAGLGVAFSTGYGDGCYPVYAEYENGRVARVTVEFFDVEDDHEADDFRCPECGSDSSEECGNKCAYEDDGYADDCGLCGSQRCQGECEPDDRDDG